MRIVLSQNDDLEFTPPGERCDIHREGCIAALMRGAHDAVDPHRALGGLQAVVHALDQVPGHRTAVGCPADPGRPAPRRAAGVIPGGLVYEAERTVEVERPALHPHPPPHRDAGLLARPDVRAAVRGDDLDAGALVEAEVDRRVAGALEQACAAAIREHAGEHREELFTLFNLGLVSLEDRAKGEVLFWDVCERADKHAQQAKYVSEEFGDLRRLLCAKYLTNFSVFRSVPDHWALDQLFPIVPIHHLNKAPTEYTTLCDITCDSDGVVDKFVDLHDVKQVLELHDLNPDEPYYIAFMLVGAYQEVMGNNHNLFGAPHEAQVFIDEEGFLIKKVIKGTTVGAAAERVRYERSLLHDGFRRLINQRVKEGELSEAEGAELAQFYESRYDAYTYLAVNGAQTRSRRRTDF